MIKVAHQSNQAVADILERVGELAAMPQVVYKILELTSTTSTSAQTIEDAIALDPGFSSKVLILANSAFYALPHRVTSIREAATFMGYQAIRQLAMTIGVFEIFVGKTDPGSLRRRTWWRHSVDSAVCAKAMAQFVPDVGPDEAYSCGLLHDIGKPLLDKAMPGRYERVQSRTDSGLNLLDAERRTFGCNHAELGGAATALWHLPDMIVDAAAQHHGISETSFPKHVALACLGSEMAHNIMEGRKLDCSFENQICSFSLWALQAIGFDESSLTALREACKQTITERSARAL